MNFLIVGLGNIGEEYVDTRHNMGFMVLDAWAKASDTSFTSERYGDVCKISHKGKNFYLLKPNTYMNLSGNAVRYWLQKLKLEIDNLLVVCDDLNLNFGNIRLRKKGSDGGHNGLKNINDLLNSQNYSRLRLGIGNDYKRGQQIDFVIGKLDDEELKLMPEICERSIEAIKSFGLIGVDRTMNFLNSKSK